MKRGAVAGHVFHKCNPVSSVPCIVCTARFWVKHPPVKFADSNLFRFYYSCNTILMSRRQLNNPFACRGGTRHVEGCWEPLACFFFGFRDLSRFHHRISRFFFEETWEQPIISDPRTFTNIKTYSIVFQNMFDLIGSAYSLRVSDVRFLVF